jgi:ribosome biogenesis GTPase
MSVTVDRDRSDVQSPQLGTVVAVQANFYQVRLDEVRPDRPSALLCTSRARLKKIGRRVMVGDRVVVSDPDWEGGRGAISEIEARRTELDRPPVANASHILLVFALKQPDLDPYQLSRFLVKAESTGLGVSLCLNKTDLSDAEERAQWRDRLQQWGYDPLFASVWNGDGLEAARDRLRHKITAIAGPSGVGKSSLIDRLIPEANLRVAEVSGKLGRGRHTTRHVELFELPENGLLADTPGFNQPDLDCTPQELVNYFPEARQRLAAQSCKFSDCLHRDEPGCAVRGDWERYDHYLDWLDTAIAREREQQQLGDAESNLKVKTKRSGKRQYEPKLASKKYRRSSRRAQHQALQDLCDDIEIDDL